MSSNPPLDALRAYAAAHPERIVHAVEGPTGPLARYPALPVDENGDLPETPNDLADFVRTDEEWEFIGDFCRSHKEFPQDQRLLSSRQVQVLVRLIEGEWGEQK